MSAVIYIDESGDLGWTFNAPYRHGGSSRHLTITAMVVPSGTVNNKSHLPERVLRHLYQKFNWSTTKEKKWADMKPSGRMEFAQKASLLRIQNPDIKFFSVTAWKQGVKPSVRAGDSNILYNHMIHEMLVDEIAQYSDVLLVPDQRVIAIQSENCLRDSLQKDVWFAKDTDTKITVTPTDSKHAKCLQFTDMLAGVVQMHFEDNKSDWWNTLSPHVVTKQLFFP